MKLKDCLMQDMPRIMEDTQRKENQIKDDIAFLLKFDGVKLTHKSTMGNQLFYNRTVNKYIQYHVKQLTKKKRNAILNEL